MVGELPIQYSWSSWLMDTGGLSEGQLAQTPVTRLWLPHGFKTGKGRQNHFKLYQIEQHLKSNLAENSGKSLKE
jgi:hypothetical protein